MTDTDLVIVGGGVMGLFTAYYASELGRRVSVLERGRVGDPATASYGRTRSYRNDYLDPTYVRLAREAIRLWDAFEAREQVRVLVRCGCLNIANSRVTPDLDATYARRSHRMLEELGMPTEALGAEAIRSRFPDLDADVGQLDAGAGVVDLAAVRETLTRVLAERGVEVVEGVQADRDRARRGRLHGHRGRPHADRAIAGGDRRPRHQRRPGAAGGLRAAGADREGPPERSPVLRSAAAGPPPLHRRRDAGHRLPRRRHLLPPDRAGRRRRGEGRLLQPAGRAARHDEHRLHRRVRAIGAFRPCAACRSRRCEDVDQCDYDLVADDDFVLGAIPGAANAFVGVGWRGTGYKFAPWVGRVLAELAVSGGNRVRHRPLRSRPFRGGSRHR